MTSVAATEWATARQNTRVRVLIAKRSFRVIFIGINAARPRKATINGPAGIKERPVLCSLLEDAGKNNPEI
jgi:hypothetical protein